MKYDEIFSQETLSNLNKQSGDNLKQMLGDKNIQQTLMSSMSLLGEIAKAEEPYKDILEMLARDMVENLYPIVDEEGIEIDAKIVSVEEVGNELDEAINPEGRRRIINGITQGAALKGAFSFYMFKEYIDDINEELVDKYGEILKNSFGIYDDENAVAMMLSLLAQGHKMAGGSSKVIINEAEETGKITIKARAICFPMLVHEIIKGLYELVSLHGFTGDKEQNQQVVDKVDTLPNEMHDIKYGKFIYAALNDLFTNSNYNDPRIREYFFQDVYQLPDEEFLSLIENAINKKVTSNQERWVDNTLKAISVDLRDDDFDKLGLDEVKILKPRNKMDILDSIDEYYLISVLVYYDSAERLLKDRGYANIRIFLEHDYGYQGDDLDFAENQVKTYYYYIKPGDIKVVNEVNPVAGYKNVYIRKGEERDDNLLVLLTKF
jgi:hypothetical protein